MVLMNKISGKKVIENQIQTGKQSNEIAIGTSININRMKTMNNTLGSSDYISTLSQPRFFPTLSP